MIVYGSPNKEVAVEELYYILNLNVELKTASVFVWSSNMSICEDQWVKLHLRVFTKIGCKNIFSMIENQGIRSDFIYKIEWPLTSDKLDYSKSF